MTFLLLVLNPEIHRIIEKNLKFCTHCESLQLRARYSKLRGNKNAEAYRALIGKPSHYILRSPGLKLLLTEISLSMVKGVIY